MQTTNAYKTLRICLKFAVEAQNSSLPLPYYLCYAPSKEVFLVLDYTNPVSIAQYALADDATILCYLDQPGVSEALQSASLDRLAEALASSYHTISIEVKVKTLSELMKGGI